MERFSLSAGTVADLGERQRSFARVGAFAGGTSEAVYTADEGDPRVVTVGHIEPRLLPTLGVAPALGRALADADVAADTVRAVMLTHATWQRLFAGDRA